MLTEKEFITITVESFNEKGIKIFPDEFSFSSETRSIAVSSKTMIMGEEFFGSYEILTADRKTVYQATNYNEAKFLIYASRKKSPEITIPLSEDEMKQSILRYEKYLDTLMKEIVSLYKTYSPEGKNSLSVMNEIMMILNLVRY